MSPLSCVDVWVDCWVVSFICYLQLVIDQESEEKAAKLTKEIQRLGEENLSLQ